MFVLNCQSEPKAYYILEEKQYIVGRKGCDFLIIGDTSISKKHAAITLKNGALEIEDVGSKYNTLINEVKLEVKKKVRLKSGDIIKFGILNSMYRIEEKKMAIIHSGLAAVSKNRLTQIIKSLNGDILSNWSLELTYLTVDKLLLTTKVLHALIEGLPIVTLEFWEEFVKRVENNRPPPIEKDYLPISSEVLYKNVSFEYNAKRKTLFKNKIFVFKKKSNLKDVITSAGGRCILFTDENISKKKLMGYDPQYLLMQEEDDKADSSHPFNKLIDLLVEMEKRVIPKPEVALAILVCSCEMNCNPDFDRVGSLLKGTSQILMPSQPLVAETQNIESKTHEHITKSLNLVPDSYQHLSEGIVETPKMEIVVIEDNVDVSIVEPAISKKASHNVGGELKRLADSNTLTSEAKRQKIKNEKQGSGSILCSRPSTSKMTNMFTSTPKEPLSTAESFGMPSLSQVSKRKYSEVAPEEKPVIGKRSKFVKNPFVFSTEKLSVTKPKSPIKKLPLIAKQEPIKRILPIENEKQCPWRSLNDTVDVAVKEEPDNTFASFKNCVIIEKVSLVVERNYKALGYDVESSSGKPKNFKRFKKVKPRYPQTTIVTSFVKVVCGNKTTNITGYVNDDVEHSEE